MAQTNEVSPEKEGTFTYLKDLAFRLSENTQVRWATLIAVILSVGGAGWNISNKMNTAPCIDKLAKCQTELRSTKEALNKIRNDYTNLNELRTERRKAEKVPTLIAPLDSRAIIGQYVTFKWYYEEKLGFKNFVLELWNAAPDGMSVRRYPIPEGHSRKTIEFQFPEPITGHFFWRIGTGELLQDYGSPGVNSVWNLASKRSDFQGEEKRLWSRFGSFSVYPSVWEKLKRRQRLVVGTTANYLSFDYPVDCYGNQDSYDMEFISWVAEKIQATLKAEVKVEHKVDFELDALKWNETFANGERKQFLRQLDNFMDGFELRVVTKIIEWKDKFTSVTSGDVDLVIANITATKRREEENPGLVFTEGYRENTQTIITSSIYSNIPSMPIKSESDLKALLKDKLVAAQNTSTNRDAAEWLNEQFSSAFEIDDEVYKSYVDVINAVRRGAVDFGMIDRVRWESVEYPDLQKIDIDSDVFSLERLFKPLYDTKFKKGEKEMYAIAVANTGGDNKFLRYLNRAIEEGVLTRKELEKRHTVKERHRRKKRFGCERPEDGPRAY